MQLVLNKRKSIYAEQRLVKPVDKVTLLLLFLGALNIINRDTYCFFIAFAWYILTNRKIAVSTKVMPVLVFSLMLLLFWKTARGTVTTMLSTFTYPICFIMGYGLLAKYAKTEDREHVFAVLVITLAAGNLLHMMLNAVSNLGVTNRNTVDIWTGTVIAATGQAGLGIMAVGVSIAVLFSDQQRKYKLLAVIALALVMWYNLTLAGRTLIVMAAATALVALAYRLSVKRSGRIKMLIMVLIATAMVLFFYASNAFGLREAILDSNLYQRFTGNSTEEVTETGRWEIKYEYVKLLLDYPFGGGKIHSAAGGYAHDLYLDTYDEAGVFAFLAVVIFIVQSLIVTVRLLKMKTVSPNLKLLALCVLLCLHMEFGVEPILAGLDWMIAFYCAIYGAIACMVGRSAEDRQ